VRRLIVNADDFGFTSGVNRAIVEAAAAGAITSTTLMAGAPRFDEAVELAKQQPRLGVGCHVVLVDGEPVLPAAKLPTLAPGGRFRDSLLRFARAVVRGELDPMEIEAEAAAQIRKITGAGLALTHFDTHKHAHLFPRVLAPVARAAVACGVRALRNPFAPVRPLAFAHLARRPRLWKRYTEVRLLRKYLRNFRETVTSMGLASPDGCYGVLVTGALDQALFDAIAGSIPEGTWEFVCHPGYDDDALRAARTRLKESRRRELEVLTSAQSRAALAAAGVELISFRELAAAYEGP
jgi:hopanoid biosynthesis associated protein HpnK